MKVQFLACRQPPLCCVLTCQGETEGECRDAAGGAETETVWWGVGSEHANKSESK